ncbi:FCS-Like Zinc finger 7-like [Curcuma longa]|uniref:FCS-Like Zinc finger 7-like n=1 Tax=Curcuma longa TaxID=136217 RepID=UPI003D9EC69D
MLVRKRPRPPMRRTTSMTEFSEEGEAPRPAAGDSQSRRLLQEHRTQRRAVDADPAAGAPWKFLVGGELVSGNWIEVGYPSGGVVPPGSGVGGRGRRRSSGGFVVTETAPFLMSCGLCKRRLGPGRDTFMYRGDTAFCSLECRQQHINQVEIKEKCSLTSMKDAVQSSNATEKSDTGESVAAA